MQMRQWTIINDRQQQWAPTSALTLAATNGSACQRRIEQRHLLHP